MQACDRCSNPATVHLTEIRGKKKTERHLCEQCARSLQVPAPQKELQKLLKTLEPGQRPSRRVADLTNACPECGLTYAEFRQSGRFGCAHDYAVFGDHVPRLLRRIHGKCEYSGKAPRGRWVEHAVMLSERQRLQRALEAATQIENYEEAARLRDALRALGPEAASPEGDHVD